MQWMADRLSISVLDRLGTLIGWLGLAACFAISAGFAVMAAWSYLHHDSMMMIVMPTAFAVSGSLGMLIWVLNRPRP